MRKTADRDRQRMTAKNRANGKPWYREGDYAKVFENAPLAAQVFNPSFYTSDAWKLSDLGDTAKGVAKGVASGTHTLGQSLLSTAGNLAGNLGSYGEGAVRYIDGAKEALSEEHDKWQKALGSYSHTANGNTNGVAGYIANNPGQAMQHFFNAWIPVTAAAAGAKGMGHVMSKLPGTYGGAFQAVGRTLNLKPEVVAKMGQVGMKAAPYLRNAGKIGAWFPLVDRTLGLTHVNPDDSRLVRAVKNKARSIVPWASALNPESLATTVFMKSPSLREGIAEGVARGVVEGGRYAASDRGLAYDYGYPFMRALSGAAKYGPVKQLAKGTASEIKDAASKAQQADPYDTTARLALYGLAQAPYISEEGRDALRRQGLETVESAPTSRLLTATGLQSSAAHNLLAQRIANAIYGRPANIGSGLLKGTTAGLQHVGSTGSVEEVGRQLLGDENAKDYIGVKNGIDAYKSGEGIIGSTRKAYNSMSDRGREAMRQIGNYGLEHIDKAVDDAIDSAGQKVVPHYAEIKKEYEDWYNQQPSYVRVLIDNASRRAKAAALNKARQAGQAWLSNRRDKLPSRLQKDFDEIMDALPSWLENRQAEYRQQQEQL